MVDIGIVSCTYDLPAPVVVDQSVFGLRLPSRIGGVSAEVMTPGKVGDAFAVPDLPGVPADAEQLADRQWANESPALDDDSYELRRVGIVLSPPEGDMPAARDGAGPGIDAQLIDAAFAGVDTWFDRLRSWVEVLTGQDLDTQAPLFDAWFEGAGLRAWRRSASGVEIVDKTRVRLTTRGERALPAPAWRFVLDRAGDAPPIEHLLMRDARAALHRGHSRRAILDAGAAAELVLIEAVDEALSPLSDAVRAAATPRSRTLGVLVGFAKVAKLELPVTSAALDHLLRMRNAATHRVEHPSYIDTLEALNTAQRLVEHVRPVAVGP